MTDNNKIQANSVDDNKIQASLTEQWEKGELKLGEHYYYTTIFSPTVYIQNFTRDVINLQDFKETVAEVLAPVPTFDEWQASEKYNKHLEEVIKIYERKDKQATETSIAYNEIAKENDKIKTENKWYSEQLNEAVKEIAQLKELLKDIRDSIAESQLKLTPEGFKLITEIVAKIDEVLK